MQDRSPLPITQFLQIKAKSMNIYASGRGGRVLALTAKLVALLTTVLTVLLKLHH